MHPNKNDLIRAQQAIGEFEQAVQALEAIERRFIRDVEMENELHSLLAKLKIKHAEYKTTIQVAERLFTQKPEELINRCMLRYFEIPTLLKRLKSDFERKVSCRQLKVNELLERSFTMSEIDKIVPSINVTEYKDLNAELERLQVERYQIESFLRSAPYYDIEALRGTDLYPKAEDSENA